jgi:uncharacterized protein with PIN domain
MIVVDSSALIAILEHESDATISGWRDVFVDEVSGRIFD